MKNLSALLLNETDGAQLRRLTPADFDADFSSSYSIKCSGFNTLTTCAASHERIHRVMLFAADNTVILPKEPLYSTACQLLIEHTKPIVVAIRTETIR
jgi:hypothetical protein